jgi:hypothetical protein
MYIQNRKKEIFEILIDTEDVKKIQKSDLCWSVGWNVIKGDPFKGHYYVKASKYLGIINGKPKYESIYLHRFLLGLTDRLVLADHINKNALDNRKENLRITNFAGNTKNRRGANINSQSGNRNVSLIEGKYIVQLQINGINTILGEFTDVNKAGEFAEKMRQKYYGEYAGDG